MAHSYVVARNKTETSYKSFIHFLKGSALHNCSTMPQPTWYMALIGRQRRAWEDQAVMALCFQKPRKTMAMEAVRGKDSPLDLLGGAWLCWHLADFCPQNPEITNACCLQPAGCAVLLLQSSETKANFTRAKSLQSCLTLCDPVDHSPPGSSVHGILQARILEWIVMPSFRGSSQPRVELKAFAPPAFVDEFFTTSATWEAQPHSGCLIYEMHCVRACMPTC